MNKLDYNRYINFIASRKNRIIDKDEYVEMHHIIPKCYSGNQGKEKLNIIELTAREHFIAHMMLWKTFGGKMTHAFNMMLVSSNKKHQRYIKLTSRQYELLRKDSADFTRKLRKGKKIEEVYAPEKLINVKKMKRKWVTNGEKSRMILVEDLDTFLKENKDYKLGHFLHSEETKSKMSRAREGKDYSYMMGDKNPAKREEVGEKISLANKGRKSSEVSKQKLSKLRTGTIWVNKNDVNKVIKKEELQIYLMEDWKPGRVKKKKVRD